MGGVPGPEGAAPSSSTVLELVVNASSGEVISCRGDAGLCGDAGRLSRAVALLALVAEGVAGIVDGGGCIGISLMLGKGGLTVLRSDGFLRVMLTH